MNAGDKIWTVDYNRNITTVKLRQKYADCDQCVVDHNGVLLLVKAKDCFLSERDALIEAGARLSMDAYAAMKRAGEYRKRLDSISVEATEQKQ